MTFDLPNPDPVPNILTGHQRLQVVSAHVVRRSLVYLLWNSLQETHWYISDRRWEGRENDNIARRFLFNRQFIISKSHPVEKHLYTCTWRRATPTESCESSRRLGCLSPSVPDQNWWNLWGCPVARWTICPSVSFPLSQWRSRAWWEHLYRKGTPKTNIRN